MERLLRHFAPQGHRLHARESEDFQTAKVLPQSKTTLPPAYAPALKRLFRATLCPLQKTKAPTAVMQTGRIQAVELSANVRTKITQITPMAAAKMPNDLSNAPSLPVRPLLRYAVFFSMMLKSG